MTPTADPDPLRDYYARRAAEYERVYAKPERQADLQAMQAWLPGCFAGRHVLEVACGTGWWTPHGARDCASWLATDLAPETIALARTKPLPAGRVRFALANAYALHALDGGPFDAAFAGFWWSHVPLARLRPWLMSLHARLQPGARVVFIDNLHVEGSSQLSRRDADGNGYQQRRLDDGSVHEVLKNFPSREQALAAVTAAGAHDARWHAWAHYWRLTYDIA